VESSCSHPREAMNLVHVRRISRRKPNCKQGRRRKEGGGGGGRFIQS